MSENSGPFSIHKSYRAGADRVSAEYKDKGMKGNQQLPSSNEYIIKGHGASQWTAYHITGMWCTYGSSFRALQSLNDLLQNPGYI